MASKHTTPQNHWYSVALLVGAFFFLLLLGGCAARKIRDAEYAHKAGRYGEAAELYRELYRKQTRKDKEKKAFFAFRAAENYRLARNAQRAKSFYVLARSYQYPDSIVLLRLAEMEQRLGRTRDALVNYEAFCALYPNDYFANLGRESCLQINTLRSNPYHYQVRLARNLNSSRSDFGGAFLPDGSAFIYSSARNKNPEIENSAITGEKPNDLYYIHQDAQGRWSRPDSISGGVNTSNDEGMPAISPDGNTLYYTMAEYSDLYDKTAKIYKSSKGGEGGWGAGKELEIWSDTLRMAAHPALSGSGEKLYFVSEGGYGGKDIYYINVEEIGSAVPTNIGGAINTPGNEISPFAVGDSTLYFASDGHPGLGGYDLYRATLQLSGEWLCEHLGVPLNSPQDDYAMTLNPKPDKNNTSEGYFSSSRQDAWGRPHLWSFTQPAILTILEGIVSDREGNPIAGALVRVVSEANPETPLVATTHSDGYYSLDIEGGTRYVLLAGADKYLRAYSSFESDVATEDAVYAIDFTLASSVVSEVFQDIFYAFDSADLLPESKVALDQIAKILQDNPEVVVELSSHADRVGSDAYNIGLSDRRARAVVHYLLGKGIPADQLQPRGYGKSRPRVITSALHALYPQFPEGTTLDEAFVTALSEEDKKIADALNRRTEFIVIDRVEGASESTDEMGEENTSKVTPEE